MSIQTFANTIGNKEHGKLIERIVYEEIGGRPGDWMVTLTEPQMSPEWTVEIDGPSGFKWTRTFFGVEEQDPTGTFIRQKVRLALP